MSVSVLIPTYRAAAFLEATLDTVAAQTLPPLEVIVADDDSPDETCRVAADWGRRAPFEVRVLKLDANSGGPAKPLNVAIAAARGDYLAFLDHDDRWHPTKLARQCEAARLVHEPCVFACRVWCASPPEPLRRVFAATEEFLNRRKTHPLSDGHYLLPQAEAYDAVASRNFTLTCSALMVPKAVAAVGFDESLSTNIEHGFTQAALARFPLVWTDEPLVEWSYRPQSLGQSSRELQRLHDEIAVLSRFDRRLLSPETRRELGSQLRSACLGHAYQSRTHGRYGAALRSYLASLRHGLSREAFGGIVKLLPHALLRRGAP